MLQVDGQIAMSDIAVELGLASTANLSLDDSRVRKIAKLDTPQSGISFSDLYGKARLEYEITQQIVPHYSYYAFGTPYFIYTKGFKVIVTEPDIVISKVRLYDNADGLIHDAGFSFVQSGGAWNVLTNNIGNGGGSYQRYVDASSATTPPPSNYAILSVYSQNAENKSVTVHRIEVEDLNGNVFRMDNHRDLTVTYGIKQVMASNKSMSTKFWALENVKAYQDVLIPENN